MRSLLYKIFQRGAHVVAAPWPHGHNAEQELIHRASVLRSCAALAISGLEFESCAQGAFHGFVLSLPELAVAASGLGAAVRLTQHQLFPVGDRDMLLKKLAPSWTTSDRASTWSPSDCVDMLYALARGDMHVGALHLVDSLMVHVQLHHNALDVAEAVKVAWSLSSAPQLFDTAAFRLCLQQATSLLQKAPSDARDDVLLLLADVIERVPQRAVPPASCETFGTAVATRRHLDVAAKLLPSSRHRHMINVWWEALDVASLNVQGLRNALKMLLIDATGSRMMLRIKILHRKTMECVRSGPVHIGDTADLLLTLASVPSHDLDLGCLQYVASRLSQQIEGEQSEHRAVSFGAALTAALALAGAESAIAVTETSIHWEAVESCLAQSTAAVVDLTETDLAALKDVICDKRRDTICLVVMDQLCRRVEFMSNLGRGSLLLCLVEAALTSGAFALKRSASVVDVLWAYRETLSITQQLGELLQRLPVQTIIDVPLFAFAMKLSRVSREEQVPLAVLMGKFGTATSARESSALGAQVASTLALWVGDEEVRSGALHHLLERGAAPQSWLDKFLVLVPTRADGVVPAIARLPIFDLLLLLEKLHVLQESQQDIQTALVHNTFLSIAEGVKNLPQPLKKDDQHVCVVMLLVLESLYRESRLPHGGQMLARTLLDVLFSSSVALSGRQEALLAVLSSLLLGPGSSSLPRG